MSRTLPVATALLAAATMLTAACDSSSGRSRTSSASTTTAVTRVTTPTRGITIGPPLVPIAAIGRRAASVAPVLVEIRPSSDHKLRVVFSGTGALPANAQWRAAGWDAVAVATLVTGAPLRDREIDFRVAGGTDGLSVGALMTVAVIALIRGDTLENDITMTGMINPDGTIGPVAGGAARVAGAAAAHERRILVPAGDAAVGAGRGVGIQVSPVADIYDAYQQMAGVTLPQLPGSTSTRLDPGVYEKIRPRVSSWLARYSASARDFASLAPELQQDMQAYANTAARDRQQAIQLTDAGLQAGAFRAAVSAAALIGAIAETGRTLPVLLTQGAQPFVSRVQADRSIPKRVRVLVETLQADRPCSVNDAGTLIAAYGDAIDAMSLSRFAGGIFDAEVANPQLAIGDLAEGAIYRNVAGSLVDAGGDVLAAGRDLGGPALGPGLDLADLAAFFRRVAGANLSAFQDAVIAPQARATNVSLSVAENVFAVSDLDYALLRAADQILASPPSVLVGPKTGDYAELAGALALYGRTASLLARYSPLGRVDPTTLQVTAIDDAVSFRSAIGLAESRLDANIGWLRSRGANPTGVASDNEIASIRRNGDAGDRFGALGDYWDGYLNSRVLAYLGGFPAAVTSPAHSAGSGGHNIVP